MWISMSFVAALGSSAADAVADRVYKRGRIGSRAPPERGGRDPIGRRKTPILPGAMGVRKDAHLRAGYGSRL
jgi:hypothetical protein